MFGIDQIGWGQFTRFISAVLFLWYLAVMLYAIVKQKGKRSNPLFEDDLTDAIQPEDLNPTYVSYRDFPSEMISFVPVEAIPLPASFYEETGMDDGYGIDRFLDAKDPLPAGFIRQIQFQQ
jgi:hypothetical protein